ncbi:MAG: DUF5696 domain-containing protein, partial [Candidatus Micrarchaeota archaeon]
MKKLLVFLAFLATWAFAGAVVNSTPVVLENDALRVSIDGFSLGMQVLQKSSGREWVFLGSTAKATFETPSGINAVLLSTALNKTTSSGGNAASAVFSKFQSSNETLDSAVTIYYTLAGSELSIRMNVVDKNASVKLSILQYPPLASLPNTADSYGVFPVYRGVILPGNDPISFSFLHPVWSGVVSMPWFGALNGGQGFIAIAQTPWDALLFISHPLAGGTNTGFQWNSSLGTLSSYDRVVSIRFQEQSSYVTLSKEYRNYLAANGLVKTLAEKQAVKPGISKLAGAFVLNAFSCTFDSGGSKKLYARNTFDSIRQNVLAFKQSGLENLLVHVDGWGARGYDNVHPYALPPCAPAGGYAGLKELADAVENAGWLFALHDDYLLFFLDSPVFDPGLAVKNKNGAIPGLWLGTGGNYSFLADTEALPFLRKTLDELSASEIRPSAYYLDVYTSSALLESFGSPQMTRRESLEGRASLFQELASRGIVSTSEAGADWASPYLDSVYWLQTPYFGIPVPLYELVHHGSVASGYGSSNSLPQVFKYALSEKYAYAMLYGEYVHIFATKPAFKIPPANAVSEVLRKTFYAEMTGHEFLSNDFLVQETQFLTPEGERVSVKVDLANSQYSISGGLMRCIYSPQYDVGARAKDFSYGGGNSFSVA